MVSDRNGGSLCAIRPRRRVVTHAKGSSVVTKDVTLASRLLESKGGKEDGGNSGLGLGLLKDAKVLLAGSPYGVGGKGVLERDGGEVSQGDAGGRGLRGDIRETRR